MGLNKQTAFLAADSLPRRWLLMNLPFTSLLLPINEEPKIIVTQMTKNDEEEVSNTITTPLL